jgi:6-phosphofructokinase 1
VAFDRVLASLFGVKAMELAINGEFGKMVAFRNNTISYVSFEEATRQQNVVKKSSYLVQAAKGLSITFGD